jgi:hypothetical protein
MILAEGVTAPLRSAVSPQGIWHKACYFDLTLGSDSSTMFRCQPAGHLAQSLQHSLRESCSFFIWGRLTMRAQYSAPYEKSPSAKAERLRRGEGIRTLGKLETYTRFPSVLLKPLGHPSKCSVGLQK